jgi:hypothetical protein
LGAGAAPQSKYSGEIHCAREAAKNAKVLCGTDYRRSSVQPTDGLRALVTDQPGFSDLEKGLGTARGLRQTAELVFPETKAQMT